MKALLLLASLYWLGETPAEAQQEEADDQGFKVYSRREVIYISNLDGSGERQLTEGRDPVISPNRKHMAFVRLSALYLMDLETEEEMQLLHHATISVNRGIQDPRWHPDGETIFFDSPSGFWIDLYAIESDGTNLRLVTKDGSLANAWPSPFSPDGRKFLYNDCFDECYTLLVFDLDDLDTVTGFSSTTSPSRTYLSRRTGYGAWSPDGGHIAFGDAWGPGLFVADSAGTQVREILDNVQVGALSWSSDSRRIAFTQVSDGGATGA